MASDPQKSASPAKPPPQRAFSEGSAAVPQTPAPTTPPPKKITLWQRIWNGSWGGIGWVLLASGGLLSLILLFVSFF